MSHSHVTLINESCHRVFAVYTLNDDIGKDLGPPLIGAMVVVPTKKCPMHQQKSPACSQKSPACSQKSPACRIRALYIRLWLAQWWWYTLKRALHYIRKRPTHESIMSAMVAVRNQKCPLYPQKRPTRPQISRTYLQKSLVRGFWINKCATTWEWVTLQIWISHDSHENWSLHTGEWVIAHIRMSHVTHNIRMSHVTNKDKSCVKLSSKRDIQTEFSKV